MAYTNPIPDMVRTTGLPSNVWPRARPQLTPTLQGCNYAVSNDHPSVVDGWVYHYGGGGVGDAKDWEWIKVRESTVAALHLLPAAQVLGHATLVRTPMGLTTMVSIAEAAVASMDESYCELLWVMMRVIERAFRSNCEDPQKFIWQREHSDAQYEHEQLLKRLRLEESRSSDRLDQHIQSWSILRESQYNDESFGQDEQKSGLWRASRLSGRRNEEQWVFGRIQAEISLRLNAVKEQQEKLAGQLEVSQRQTEEVLLLLRAMSGGTLRGERSEQIASSGASAEKVPAKICIEHSSNLRVRSKGDEWFLCGRRDQLESKAFALLLDWLEARLSVTINFFRPPMGPLRNINLKDESTSLGEAKKVSTRKREDTTGCWRTKILSGNILEIATGDVEQSANSATFERFRSGDCLILTAAAMWSLFDNTLVRVRNCQCTFRAASGDFIQCRHKDGEWFVWHTFSEGPVCEGQTCDRNIRIALTADEAGDRLYITTPCALGWPAMSRHSPDSTIWTTLSATTDFQKKTAVSYRVKEIQALAQLGVPAVVSPQFGGAVTFAKRYYEIANSIDHESIIAMERVAAAVVLVFDERRGFHLACDGADII